MDIRVYGHDMKPGLHLQMKRLGVEILDRVMLTAPADGGRQARAGASPA